jgi:histidine triad (HIT) family protein
MCLFCKIVKDEIPSKRVLENDDFIAFHDINPIAPIHLLNIPKQHVDSFNEVNGQMMSNMTSFMQDVAKEINISQSGYRVITNIGDDGSQEVKHLHFHMLGGAKLSWSKL